MVMLYYVKNNLNTNKLIVMIVPTTILVTQQTRNINEYFASLNYRFNVIDTNGTKHYEKLFWDRFKNKGIVCVADVFEQALSHGALNITDVCLLIYDECHHATKDHRYKVIQEAYYLRIKNQYLIYI